MEVVPAAVDQRRALDQLIRADLFEQVLQQRYLGSKRFSLEGVTALIPLLDEILDGAGRHGTVELLMGMSHRGRLNVITHIVRRTPEEVFAGFEDVDPRSVLGGGDVKYHMGATGQYLTRSGAEIHVHMVSNPSHLEAVDPVAIGRARAKQDRAGQNGSQKVLPLLIHGDGAFAGQGILAEVLNYADLPGYSVGGTIHVIVNNLIGFTTVPRELHSSRFAAQIARRQNIPILHVNGEDVDAVIRVGRLALEYRARFHSDVVVDLIGYRRHGHSEVDDPTITQPLLYKAIKDHAPLWEIYASDIGAEDAAAQAQQIKREFEEAQKKAVAIKKKPLLRDMPVYWNAFLGYWPRRVTTRGNHGIADVVSTRLSYSSQGQETSRTEGGNGHGKKAGGLRDGGSACLRKSGEGRHPGAPHRAGQPARHLQSTAFGTARY
jgi:2-oxoglutarate dehydrogenase E1 component